MIFSEKNFHIMKEREILLDKALDLIDRYSVTAYEIEQNTSLSAVGVQKIINKETKKPLQVTLETIISYIERKYEYQEEEVLKQENEVRSVEVVNQNNIQAQQEVVRIPYYDVDFAGGWSTEELFTNANPSYYISAPEFDRAEFACNLRGNSISKRIKSGSIVGLKEVKDWQTYFPNNELYGIITKNDLRTIKIVKRSKDKGFLDLIPDPLPEHNTPSYEIDSIPTDFVVRMFQVVAWGFYERLIQ